MRYTKFTVYIMLYLFTIGIVISSIVLRPHPLDSPLIHVVRIIIVGFASVLLTRYAIYMVLTPWNSLFAKRDKKFVDHFVKYYKPLVSVMIPCWNEEKGILVTIRSLLSGVYKRLEIVVVNDGSTDNSDLLIRQFIAQYEATMADIPPEKRVQIVYHYKQNGGKGSALNTAISLAHGEILLSIDADCAVEANAIAAFVEAFKDPRTMAAVGNVKISSTRTLLGTVQFLEFCFSFMLKNADSLLNTIYIIGGAAGAFRREVFDKLGGYSTTNITEDIALSMAVQDQGWRIAYVPDAIIYTEGASTLQGLLKQRLRWKRGRFQTFWEYRHMFFSLNPRHNKILCWVILPLTLFSEAQLSLEPIFLLVLYAFSFLSSDFSAFLSGIIVVFLMFLIQAWDAKEEQGIGYIFLAPIGWLLFYLCSFVEVYSLAKSVWMMLRKQELKWQVWERKGLLN